MYHNISGMLLLMYVKHWISIRYTQFVYVFRAEKSHDM